MRIKVFRLILKLFRIKKGMQMSKVVYFIYRFLFSNRYLKRYHFPYDPDKQQFDIFGVKVDKLVIIVTFNELKKGGIILMRMEGDVVHFHDVTKYKGLIKFMTNGGNLDV